MNARLAGFSLCLVAAAGFASGAIFAKGVYAGSETRVLTLMLWRFGLGAGATWLWLLASPARRAALAATPARVRWLGLGLGVVYFGNSAAYFAGLEEVPASLAGLLVFIYPALNAVLSLRWGRRLEGSRAWTGLGLALVGGVLAVGGIPATAMPPPTALGLAILAPIVYSIWLLLQSQLTGERPGGAPSGRQDGEPIVVAALVNTGAAGAYLAIASAAGQPLVPPTSDPGVWGMVAGIGLLSAFVAIVGVTEGSRRIGAAQAALVSTAEPVFVILFSALLLGESLTATQLAGGALIMAGVLLSQSRGSVRVGSPTLAGLAED